MCGPGVCACCRLEIMEQMAVLQEAAYEQLYRWAQSEYYTLLQPQKHSDFIKGQGKTRLLT